MLPPALLSRRELLAALGTAGLAGLGHPIANLLGRAESAGARGHSGAAASADATTPADRPSAGDALDGAVVSSWGIQLYTLRDVLQRDFAGTIAALATIGYKEVETAGYYGKSPADVRRVLDENGMTAPSAHVDYSAVTTNLQPLLDDCATIGHKWLVVPSLPGSMRTADGYKRVGEGLAKAAAQARGAGVRIAYHNHDVDFAPLNDTNGMDLILASSPADAVFAELDVYWIVRAGRDPFAFLKEHPGRVKMLHLKDSGGPTSVPAHEMRDVGAGVIDWPRLLTQAEAAGVEHNFVEHDRPTDALTSARASYQYLSRLSTAGRGGGASRRSQ
jgi:sugar phosphate isomerase/epimerase